MSHQETSPKSSVKRGLWLYVYNSHFVILHRLAQHCAQVSYTSSKKRGGYNSENWIQKEWPEEQRGRCYYTESAHHLFPVMLLEFANSWAETCPPARVSVRVEWERNCQGGWPCKFTPVIQGESARISVGLTHSPTRVKYQQAIQHRGGLFNSCVEIHLDVGQTKLITRGKIWDHEWKIRKLRIKFQLSLVTSMCWTTKLNSASWNGTRQETCLHCGRDLLVWLSAHFREFSKSVFRPSCVPD